MWGFCTVLGWKYAFSSPFSAYGKVGANQKYLLNMSCFWRTIIVYFTSFKDQFNPGKWKKSLKVKNFVVVNSEICAIFTLCHCKNWPPGAEVIFLPKNFILKYFKNWCGFNYFWTKIYSWEKFKGNWFSDPKRSGQDWPLHEANR